MASLTMWRELNSKTRKELYDSYRSIYPNIRYSQVQKDFDNWYKKVAEYKDLNPNPYDKNHYYDYEGFYNANKNKIEIPYILTNTERMLTGDRNSHFTDTYKLPGHPTFSNESMYSNSDTPGGIWIEDQNGRGQFQHSDYTINYSDRTIDYLKGTNEYATYKGGYVLPEIVVTAKKKNSNNIIDKKDSSNVETTFIPNNVYNNTINQDTLKQNVYTGSHISPYERNINYWDPIKGAFERWNSSLK